MRTLIVRPETKAQLKAMKAFLKALKIPFEIEKPVYGSRFVAKIEDGMAQVKRGETRTVNIAEL